MADSRAPRIDLDDSRVVRIEREPSGVTVALEQCRGPVTRNFTVRVLGPWQEEVAYYVGEGVTAPHPNPSLPLDFVEYAAAGPRHVDLQGYLQGEAWFAWSVTGSAVEITELAPPPGAPPNNSSKPTPLRGAA